MPPWLLLSLCLLGLSSVVPLFVWAVSGRWRDALTAWKQYGWVMLAMAAPGLLVGLGYLIWPPLP